VHVQRKGGSENVSCFTVDEGSGLQMAVQTSAILKPSTQGGMNMKNVAIFVHAGENELGRAVHGLLYAEEINAAGGNVKLIFDGEGTLWIRRFEDPSHPMNPLYKKVKELGVIEACEYCAGAFGATEDVQKANISSAKDNQGHASIAKLIAEDYHIITL
jgi:hypothetical protein